MTFDEDLKSLVALSWDCGAITTGEVTVPVIVGLGSGASTEEYVKEKRKTKGKCEKSIFCHS